MFSRTLSRITLRWLLPLIGGALALGVLFLLYRDLDFTRFRNSIATANLGWIVLLVLAILLEFLIQGWKWRQLIYDLKPISSLRLAAAILAGYGANVLVPLGISPFVRAWLVARLEGLRMATLLITTAISRFVDGIVFSLFAGAVALSGRIQALEGDLRAGLALAALLNGALFSAILWLMFRSRAPLASDDNWLSRLIDWAAARAPRILGQFRSALAGGLLWPTRRWRQLAIILASFAGKLVAATHFFWAGLAVGVTLGLFDYLLVMVIAGFALVLTRLVRVPGGFMVGSAFALDLLGVPAEQALAMILFSNVMATVVVVSFGLLILWQSGIDIRRAAKPVNADDLSAN